MRGPAHKTVIKLGEMVRIKKLQTVGVAKFYVWWISCKICINLKVNFDTGKVCSLKANICVHLIVKSEIVPCFSQDIRYIYTQVFRSKSDFASTWKFSQILVHVYLHLFRFHLFLIHFLFTYLFEWLWIFEIKRRITFIKGIFLRQLLRVLSSVSVVSSLSCQPGWGLLICRILRLYPIMISLSFRVSSLMSQVLLLTAS